MRDFSIDLAAEKINSPRSKKLFQEVIKSYYSENYRSCVVMLYSISICDLIYKLQQLRDLYNEPASIEILSKIESMKNKNPYSSEWESQILELVHEKTNLLEPHDFTNLVHLQKLRHLSAHPILNENFDLFEPNKETTRAFVRNVLEGLLMKPALLSKRVVDDFVVYLSEIKNIVLDDSQMSKHLDDKYFSKLPLPLVHRLFKSLWKFVFVLENTECNANREINLRAIKMLSKRFYDKILQFIIEDSEYYEAINSQFVFSLKEYLNSFPEIFIKFSSGSQSIIKSKLSTDVNHYFQSNFLFKNIAELFEQYNNISYYFPGRQNISFITLWSICERIIAEGEIDQAKKFAINEFINSSNFNDADRKYHLIEMTVTFFNLNDFMELLEGIEKNSQIYNRSAAYQTNSVISGVLDQKTMGSFDYSQFPHFVKSIQSH